MNSILEDFACDIIDVVYEQTKSKRNINKIRQIYTLILNILFENIQPYFYTLILIVLLLLVMNIVQFYYLIKISKY